MSYSEFFVKRIKLAEHDLYEVEEKNPRFFSSTSYKSCSASFIHKEQG